MGSDSDFPVMKSCVEQLRKFKIPHEVKVCSAHRTPVAASTLAANARDRGVKVIIAAAGGAAHLAGVMASHTPLPVIGVPCTSTLDGLDSLLSTVQMPPGVPVATVAIGKMGAPNAAILALQILALTDEGYATTMDEYKKSLIEKVAAKDKNVHGQVVR
ncbi:MAG: 5-(carboxyamino)imidazole ribonucleotide mutase [Planctomycetota bacterium]|nr:5-(carboxyamino)imidazole ribonucleotide mutase [Planctomycetota bacterium]